MLGDDLYHYNIQLIYSVHSALRKIVFKTIIEQIKKAKRNTADGRTETVTVEKKGS